MSDAYPKRPAFFACKFGQLMYTRHTGQKIGADGCALLMMVVLEEDAQHYGGPVDFWNGQLMLGLGIGSEDTLARIRQRCVDAGWLHYTPGSRSRAARYYVTEPGEVATEPDGEHPQLCGSSTALPEPTPATVRQFTRSMCGTSLPVPVPEDIPAAAGVAAKTPPKEKRVKKPRPRNPLFDAIAEVTGADPVVNGAQVGKVAALFSAADPPYTPDEVREFARTWRTLLPWATADKYPRPTVGVVEKYLPQLRAALRDAHADNAPRIKRADDNPLVNDDTIYTPLGGTAW